MTNKYTLDEYQQQAETTFVVDKYRLAYLVFGLCSECGEVADQVKKHIRDSKGEVDKFDKDLTLELIKEVGDVLWYTAVLAAELKFDLSQVAEININKLTRRMNLDLIQGSGDNR
jgi:NTP pyrophosphatase (non-canonical NTP hydrolase)